MRIGESKENISAKKVSRSSQKGRELSWTKDEFEGSKENVRPENTSVLKGYT